MAVTTFLTVGFLAAAPVLISVGILVELVVAVSAIVRVFGVVAAIVREGRDRPRAQARDRWSNSLRRWW